MTEDEAKTKWCPFAQSRVVSIRQPTGLGVIQTTWATTGQAPTAFCIGSACVAWQISNKRLGHDPSHRGTEAAAAYTAQNPLHGYCGLAGATR